jgi:hypothetical protein
MQIFIVIIGYECDKFRRNQVVQIPLISRTSKTSEQAP